MVAWSVHTVYTVEPLNNGHVGDEHFVHCSEDVPSSEVEMYGQLMEGGKQFVHCREVVLLSEVSIIGGFTVHIIVVYIQLYEYMCMYISDTLPGLYILCTLLSWCNV